MNDSVDKPTSRRWLLLVLLGVLCHAPALGWEFLADDHGHELILSGAVEHESLRPWALYDFGTLAEQLHQRDSLGTFPYWTPDAWRVKFLRPVSSLVRWFEHVVTGGSAVGTHAFGLLWWGLLLVLAHRFFRGLGLSTRAAGWGLLFLALESGNVASVGWPANRNSVVEAIFLLASLTTFLGTASVRGRGGSLALAFLATLAKESGVVAFPLLAWLAWRRGERRFAMVALGCAAAYLGAYVALGYGSNTPFYPTPWAEPVAWAERLGVLLPCLWVFAATPLSSDVAQLVPGLVGAYVVLGVLLFATLGSALRSAARDLGAFPWLFVLATLLPQAGAPLSDRLFLVPGIAMAALLGAFVVRVGERVAAGEARLVQRWGRVALVAGAGALSGLALVQVGVAFGGVTRFARDAVVEAEVGDPAVGPREVIVLQAPSQLVALQPRSGWMYFADDPDVRFWSLSFSREGVAFRRTGEHLFELTTTGAPFFSGLFASVFLTADVELEVGARWTNEVMTVRALEIREGRPTRVEVELRTSLDDPRVRFLRWRPGREGGPAGRWVHVPPPAIGQEVVVQAVPSPLPFLP